MSILRKDEPEPEVQPMVVSGKEAHQLESLVTYQNALRVRDELVVMRERVVASTERAERVLETAKKELRREIT
jgi:hypothetical protein